MRTRVFIDANIPMYAAGAEHSLKYPSLQILEAAATGKIAAVTNTEVIQEIMHRYASLNFREKGLEVAELFLQVTPNVLPVTKKDMIQALALYQAFPQVQARDTVHAAVMQSNGVTIIITADRHFDRFAGLRRVDPTSFEKFLKGY
ncbi:MAG: type II toxin-antitoxin system VapC family toxin [Chloroflexota bacterium]|nr:type II toxin-antitoxin system VapC family toxin [Chloroflexota bacterium]